jgi:hypothetical protein
MLLHTDFLQFLNSDNIYVLDHGKVIEMET